jgi:hypothetical protein
MIIVIISVVEKDRNTQTEKDTTKTKISHLKDIKPSRVIITIKIITIIRRKFSLK